MWSLADLYERLPLLGPLYRWTQPRVGWLFSQLVLWNYRRRAGVGSAGDPSLNTNTLHAAYHPIEAEKVGKKQLQPMAKGAAGRKSDSSGEKKEL